MSADASAVAPAEPSATASDSTPPLGSTVAILPLRDAASRMFLLSRLVASFDDGDQTVLAQLIGCGCTPELLDRLRGMTMIDAIRFTAEHCGLALGVDSAGIQRQLRHLERRRADREIYEYLIRAGASPVLLGQLFTVTTTEVRRLRKIIAPGVALVGRPRLPDEGMCEAIVRHWERICTQESSERQRYVLLHKAFDGAHLIATLESALESYRRRVASLARISAARSLRPGAEPTPRAAPVAPAGPAPGGQRPSLPGLSGHPIG